MKSLRVIAASKCSLVSTTGFLCDLPQCNNALSDKPSLLKDKIYCQETYECVLCCIRFHKHEIASRFSDKKCVCMECSNKYKYGSGPIKLDPNLLNKMQYLYDYNGGPERPYVGACMRYITDKEDRVLYTFTCTFYTLPNFFAFASWHDDSKNVVHNIIISVAKMKTTPNAIFAEVFIGGKDTIMYVTNKSPNCCRYETLTRENVADILLSVRTSCCSSEQFRTFHNKYCNKRGVIMIDQFESYLL